MSKIRRWTCGLWRYARGLVYRPQHPGPRRAELVDLPAYHYSLPRAATASRAPWESAELPAFDGHRSDVLNYEHFDCCGQGMVPKLDPSPALVTLVQLSPELERMPDPADAIYDERLSWHKAWRNREAGAIDSWLADGWLADAWWTRREMAVAA